MDFSELYLTYYSKLVRFAKEFVILEEDAENITQDVFDVELESLDIFSSYSSSDEEVFVVQWRTLK